MRLRLNTTLRAALIAAITAVGFTLTSAQAANVTLANVMNQKAETPIIWGENGLDLTSVTASCTTAGVRGNNAYENSFRAVDTNVGNGATWTYTLNFTTGADTNATLSSVTADLLTFNGSNNPHNTTNYVNVDWTLSGGGQNLSGSSNNAELTFRSTATADTAAYASDGQGGYVTSNQSHYCGGTVKFDFDDFALASETTYTLTLAVSRVTETGFFVGIGNVALVQSVEVTTSTWNGTAANNKWSEEASWTGGVPTAISPVVFDSGAQNKTVDVDTKATADSIAVNAPGYEFQLNNNLTTCTLTIADGASLSLIGSGTMEISGAASIAAGGSMSVSAGATLKLDDGTTAAQLLQTVTGDGNITLATDVELEGTDSQASAPTSQVTGTLTLDHSTLRLGKLSTGGAFADKYVNLSSFSHIKLDNATLWVHSAPMTINGVTVENGTSNIHIQDTADKNRLYLTLAGTTSVAANSTLKFVGTWKYQTTIEALAGEGTLDLAGPGGNSIYNIGGGSIGKLQISTNVVSNVTGDLTVGGLDGTQGTVNVSDGKNLTFNVAEGGNHSFTGTLTVGGQIVKLGTGSQTISGTALHRTLDVQAGTLALNGNFAIDAITDGDTHISYVNASGAESTNGFQNASGTLNVYDTHSSAGTVNLDNGHFTYGGKDVTADIQNGVYTLAGEVDYTVLYVNSGSEAIAAYQTAAQDKGKTLSGAVLKDTATLTVDADFAGSVSAAEGKGNVVINEGNTLTGTGSNITLTGAGTYALNSGDKTLGSGTTLGNDWTGAVRLSGVSMGGENLKNNYAKNSSWVEMAGVTGGYIEGWQGGSEAANIILTNPDGGVAWKWSDGSSSGETLITFSGTWKGAGTFFKDTNNKRQGYKYTGNISGWTGDFRAKATDANAVTRLEFAGSATDVKIANIQNEGVSALNVVLSTGGTMSVASNISKTGTGAVNISLTNSTAATLSGTVVADSLTIASGSSLTNTGALTLNGGVSFGNAPIVNNGTVTFGANVVFDLSTLTASGNKYTLFSGTNTADLSGLGMSNIINYTAGASYVFGKDGTISFTTSASKVWTGDPGADWNHTDLTWEDGTPFEDGDSVQFGDEAYVNVGEDVAASVISVEGDSVLYLSATEGAHLSADSLAVGAGSGVCTTVAIDGLQTYSLGEGSSWVIGADQTLETAAHGGLVIVDEGAVVTVNGTSTASDLSGFANDGGTLSVALADATGGDDNIVTMQEVDEETPSSGTFELRSGTIDYRSDLGNQTLKLDDGTRLLFGRANGDTTHTYAGDILVAGNAKVRSHGTSQHPQVTISGDVTGEGTLTRENDGNQALNFTGTVNLGGYTNSDAQSGSSTDFQGDTTLGTLTADAGSTTKFSGSKADLGTMTVKGNAAVEINTTATISSMLDLSDAGKSSGTVTVKANKSLSIAEGATYWGGKNSAILMEEGGILNLAGMQIVGGAGIEAVVETTADNTQYGIDSDSWSINGADITATKNISVGNELYFSTIDTGAYTVQLTNTENTLSGATVGTGGSLSMTEGTLFSVIESGGSVTLTGTTLDKESFIEQGGETGSHYDLNGQLTDGDNYYLGTSEKYLTVVNGGTSATGTNLTWGDATGLTMTGGKVVTEAGEVVYETFYVNADSVNVSAITNAHTTDVAVAGGTLVVDKETSLNITVTDEGTISGDKADAKQVGIAEGATAYYTGGVEDSGVKFTPSELLDGAVEVDNYGQTQKYSIASRDLSVAAAALEMTGTEDVTVSNYVVVDELVNTTDKVLTLDNQETFMLLTDMSITGSTVQVYTDATHETEGVVAIAGILQGGGATLKADLTLYGGSTLDVDGGHVAGGTMNALTLGSTLTIDTTTGLVNLDQDTINALAGLSDGQYLDLIVAADQTKLNYGGSYEGVSYDTLFSATGLTGPYTVYAHDNAFGLVKGSNVPEPTTGTLSLLALAALAARRRRK